MRVDIKAARFPDSSAGVPPAMSAKHEQTLKRDDPNLPATPHAAFAGGTPALQSLQVVFAGNVLRAPVRVAFVSTNSITQGERVGVLWNYLLEKGIMIHFCDVRGAQSVTLFAAIRKPPRRRGADTPRSKGGEFFKKKMASDLTATQAEIAAVARFLA